MLLDVKLFFCSYDELIIMTLVWESEKKDDTE